MNKNFGKKPGTKTDPENRAKKRAESRAVRGKTVISREATTTASKALTAKSSDYGIYTQVIPAAPNATKLPVADLSKTMAPIHAQLKAQKAEIDALKKRLAQMEAAQKAQTNAYHVPQSLAELSPRRLPPAGMTGMGAIMGQLDVEETAEELLAQLKALD